MKESAVNLPIYAGSILAMVSLVSFLITMQPLFLPGLGLSIFFVIIGFINKNREPIKLFENHMELKFAPAAPIQLIRYKDLIRLEDQNRNFKKLFFLANQQEKKVLIPLKEYNKEDMEDFGLFLEEKINENKNLN